MCVDRCCGVVGHLLLETEGLKFVPLELNVGTSHASMTPRP